ncbi:aldehyde dehydrogenase family protein [Microbacterium immunditiarum]|uniref:NADP-dependent aldehyde dehydrogenase n=1 Tax=Microbacterium immunditiarum TaxID=337480 RepID=A0A7Y9KJD3_9MICO|nr:aldehyde dehydrogenase family protein [Microbacterium immunditiarum]NYE21532.1 NADP-dependent aldehyde dehydrogenase [Microbacterium immunditiarum]
MTTVSFRPRDGVALAAVEDTAPGELDGVVMSAVAAARVLSETSAVERERWLGRIAEALEAHRDELVGLADTETALGEARLSGEVGRMADQLRFYGTVAAEGSYLGIAVDNPTATSPRLVRANRPVGPVAVFGASNFPFAFGALGNDTGSAIAAGCPVIVKAHPAHVHTCIRLVAIAQAALAEAGAPDGTLSLVVGLEIGAELVRAPGVRAVGFTGSQRGGLALWRIANERDDVIPVFAEMGTVNPVVVTPRAAARMDEIADGFAGSFTLGSGQFCTKPGLLLVPAGHGAAEAVGRALGQSPPPVMLTEAIAHATAQGIDGLVGAGATVVARIEGNGEGWSADAAVLSAPLDAIRAGSRLLEECFGAVAVVVEYEQIDQATAALATLQASLTGAVFADGDDDPDTARFVEVLASQTGRVTVGDWPTGVAWTWAQQHGGPWPATSQPASTSVGAAALDRFVRPVAYQSVPDSSLPAPVRAAINGTSRVPRRVDGVFRSA